MERNEVRCACFVGEMKKMKRRRLLLLYFRILSAWLREREDFAEIVRVIRVIFIREPFHFRVKKDESQDGEDHESRSAELMWSVFHCAK